MVTKFTRKELERLKCTEEEIELIIMYQKKLPILIENGETEKFCVDARTLHSQLGVGKKFSEWIKQRIKVYKFAETIDFTLLAPNGETKFGGDTRSVNYSITMDMAKQLCMIEKNDTGIFTRRYFILMEDLIKRNDNWWRIRKPQKENYKPMCRALSESIHKATGRSADDYDYKFEVNRLNIIATGSTAQAIKLYLGMQPNELTRDGLETDYNEKIAFLQEQNMLLLGMNMPLIDRVKMLITMFDIKYPTASPIMSYLCRDDLIKARINMVEELEGK